MKEFRLYVMTRFPPGTFVSKQETITDIFTAISDHCLWDYNSYTSVENICKEYGGDDEELLGKINNYKSDLAGFQATTKIVEYIRNCSINETADSEQSIGQDKARYNKMYCKKLSIKLEIPVPEKCLNYIDELWRSISDLFLLPSLPVLLESIREGCTEVTWYISTQAASQFESVVLKEDSIELYWKYHVLTIALEGRILYSRRKV